MRKTTWVPARLSNVPHVSSLTAAVLELRRCFKDANNILLTPQAEELEAKKTRGDTISCHSKYVAYHGA